MTRYVQGNAPTHTYAELFDLVRSVAGSGIEDGDLYIALDVALTTLAAHMTSLFYYDVVVPCDGTTVLDIAPLGIQRVTNVQMMRPGNESAARGYLAWRDIPFWRLQGGALHTPPLDGGVTLRIEFAEAPPVYLLETTYQVATAVQDAATLEYTLTLDYDVTAFPIPREPARIPVAGYVRIKNPVNPPTIDDTVLEYVGISTDEVMLTLKHCAQPSFVATPVTVAVGDTVQFVLPLRDARMVTALRMATLAAYWTRWTSACDSDEDRNFASQMMVFYAGEREKLLKGVPTLPAPRAKRVRFRDDAIDLRCHQ